MIGFIAGCMAGAVLSLSACGGGGDDVGQVEPAVIVCRASDLGCRQTAKAMKSRACTVMPEGLPIYLDNIGDAQMRDELKRAGAWSVGNWIEGEDCA